MTNTIILTAVLVALVFLIIVVLRDRSAGREHSVGESVDDLSNQVEDLDKALRASQSRDEAHFEEMTRKVETLQKDVTSREATLHEQVNSIGGAVKEISSVFANDRARGGWGEMSLGRLFESAGLMEGRDYTSQFNSGDGIPDAVVHLPGSRNLVIDAKFPIARFNEALSAGDTEQRSSLLKRHAKELESTAKSLNAKGYKEHASGGYVVMYLPSQAVWEAAVAADAELLNRLMRQRVIVAGPNALFALLLTAGTLLAEHRFLDEANEILDDAKELHKRLRKFVGDFNDVGTRLAQAVRAFNEAAGSWKGRLVPQITRMTDRASLDQLEEPERIEGEVRELADERFNVAS